MILSLFSDEDTNTHEEERFKDKGSGDTLSKLEFSLVSTPNTVVLGALIGALLKQSVCLLQSYVPL